MNTPQDVPEDVPVVPVEETNEISSEETPIDPAISDTLMKTDEQLTDPIPGTGTPRSSEPLPPIKVRPGVLLTPRIAPTDTDPNSPSVYPLLIMSFCKLFWQSGQNIKFELFRLVPSLFSRYVQ